MKRACGCLKVISAAKLAMFVLTCIAFQSCRLLGALIERHQTSMNPWPKLPSIGATSTHQPAPASCPYTTTFPFVRHDEADRG